MVTISLDDGWESQFSLARPALVAHGIRATYFLISDPIANKWSDYLSLSQAQTLAAEGNEIGSHTVTHPHLPDVSSDQVAEELTDSRAWLSTNLGLASIGSFATPYGEFNDAVVAQIRETYPVHRTQVFGRVFNADDPSLLRGTYVRSKTSVAAIHAMLDETIVEKGWLILTFHKFVDDTPSDEDEYSASDFEAILDDIHSRGIKVVTVAEGARLLDTEPDPTPTRFVFGDDLGNDFENWSWGYVDLHSRSVVYSDHSAIAFEPNDSTGLMLHSNRAIDAAIWNTVELWVHGGTSGGQEVQLSIRANKKIIAAVPIAQALGHPIRPGVWERVQVSLGSLGLSSGTFTEIGIDSLTGRSASLMYVDGFVLRAR